MTPKYSISNFTKDNIYWLKNTLPVKIGGNNIIASGFYTSKIFDSDTNATYANITNATGISNININNGYQAAVYTDGTYIFLTKFVGGGVGQIHQVVTDSGTDVLPSQATDLIVTSSNNIIYCGARYMCIGYYFIADGGSSTYLQVDDTDFTALGVTNGAGKNKIFDITTGEEYTVTSVSETGNVRLNFGAGAGTPAQYDEFFVFLDYKTGFDLTTADTGYNIHFKGQDSPNTWVRQIQQLDDRFFITNGNYLAMLSADETTLTNDYQQLPKGVQATCLSVNNDLILVGGEYKNTQGRLMVYDGFSSYFKSIVNTLSAPVTISPYQAGWIVCFKDGEIRYTDGVSWKTLTTIPDTNTYRGMRPMSFNSSAVADGRLFLSVNGVETRGLRMKSGIHIYDMEMDIWSFSRAVDAYGNTYKSPSAIYSVDSLGAGSNSIYYAKNGAFCALYSGTPTTREIFLNIKLPKKENIKRVELNFSMPYNLSSTGIISSDTTATVRVSSGDGRYGFYGYSIADSTSTTTNIVPDNYRGQSFVGQMIQIYEDGQSSTQVNGDEYTYITAITDSGEATEHWTVSPALTANFAEDQQIGKFGLCLAESKDVTYSTLNKDLTFNIKDHYGDKLYLHIYIDGALDLYSILLS